MSQSKPWKSFAASLALAALSTAPLVATAGPALSGPSIVKLSSTVTFAAHKLPANAAVTLAVITPGGAEAHHSHVTTASGTLKVSVTAAQSGPHQVKLLDSGGRQLAAAMFIAQ
jgi:hypothetical protein